MTEVLKGGMDFDSVILFVGIVLLALLVLLRNRPFIFLARVFRLIGRPLGRILRPVMPLLRALGIVSRHAGKEARNYVGPSAFSSLIRAFRWKTEVEQELDKTEFMAQIAEKAIKKTLPGDKSVPLEDAAREFHEEYAALRELLSLAFERADGEMDAALRNFEELQQNPPEGYARPGIYLDPYSVESALKNEQDHLVRRGVIFKWLEPQGGFVRKEDMEWEEARTNYFLANIFFTYDIPVGTPRSGIKATNLYEEVDGAFSVSMFGIKDRDVYYLFTEMRKIINGNVRRLALLFSLIATLFFLFNIYIAGDIPPLLADLLDLESTKTIAGIEVTGQTNVLLLSFVFSAVAMWLLYTAEYRHYVRNNGREMNNFLTRYLARLNNFYRQAERNARGVFAGEVETDKAEMEEHAQIWFSNIQWMAFRAFYVETFLRNTMYQIHRNSGYYVILVPLVFVAGTFLLLLSTNYITVLGDMFVWKGWPPDPQTLHTAAFAAALVLLIMMVTYYLTNSLSELEGTIREDEWFNFHHFALQRTTTNLIGRYGNEIKFWRERLKAGQRTSG